MTSAAIRQKYLDFFVKKGHKIIGAAPLVPENDPTTLFTSCGMQPLVPYLKGEPHPAGKRLVDCQPSLRLQDIEEVGDNRHTTFFEMLGNWSLGDYFKKEQLAFCLDFLTNDLGLPQEKLFFSVFAGDKNVPRDKESAKIWQDLGIPKEKIFYYPAEKNWWSRSGTSEEMPAGEIGGPDSEVFFDLGESYKFHENSSFKTQDCHPNCGCGRFLEIGNSVFIEYQKNEDNSLSELPQKNVDFGAGLERLVAAVNHNPDIFQIDLFKPIIVFLEERTKIGYGQAAEKDKSFRVIADHLRAATFLAAQNVTPSNVEQGYVLRRLLRRVIRHGRLLGMTTSFTPAVSEIVVKSYGDAYPQLYKNKAMIGDVFLAEEEKFAKTLAQGLKEFEKVILAAQQLKGKTVPGDKVFYLYESFGFPPELTAELAKEKDFSADTDGFKKALVRHKETSRKAAQKKFAGGLIDHSQEVTKLHTATHLLHQALRIVLGQSVRQAGSNITSERLRFDFPYPQKLTPEQIQRIEELVNQKIKENLPVKMEIMSLSEAKKQKAIGFFEEKYEDQVKVYSVADFSKEICGGPHVDFTGKLGSFKIMKEEKISSSIRRIYAVLDHK